MEAGVGPDAADLELGQRALHPRQRLDAIATVRDTFYGGKYEIHLFHYRWLGGDIRLNEEHTEYAWVAAEEFRNYDVMDGIDEDIHYLEIWPDRYLRADKLPKKRKPGM